MRPIHIEVFGKPPADATLANYQIESLEDLPQLIKKIKKEEKGAYKLFVCIFL